MVYAEVPDDPTAYKRQEYWQVTENHGGILVSRHW